MSIHDDVKRRFEKVKEIEGKAKWKGDINKRSVNLNPVLRRKPIDKIPTSYKKIIENTPEYVDLDDHRIGHAIAMMFNKLNEIVDVLNTLVK